MISPKRALVVLLLLVCIFPQVMAFNGTPQQMIDYFNSIDGYGHGNNSAPSQAPMKVVDVHPLEEPMDVQYTEVSSITIAIDNFIGGLKRAIGLDAQPIEDSTTVTLVDVYADGQKVGTIPDDSKFYGMTIHKSCLVQGYGTEGWFKCENGDEII